MGKRGPSISEKERAERVRKLARLLRDQKAGRIPNSQTALCAAMGFSIPTVRKIAKDAGLDFGR